LEECGRDGEEGTTAGEFGGERSEGTGGEGDELSGTETGEEGSEVPEDEERAAIPSRESVRDGDRGAGT